MSARTLAELVSMLALAAACAGAGLTLLRAFRERRDRVAAVAWALLCLSALGAWPAGVDADRLPVTFARLIAPLLAPAFWAFRARPWMPRALRLFCGACAAWAGAVALRTLLAARPGICGIDFFSYVDFARDALDGISATAPARFHYFPGVFLFWEAALVTTGRTLAGLQWWFAAVLLLGAAGCALAVFRASRSVALATFAGAATLVLDFSLEGRMGMTEPIAVLPALAGFCAWSGAPLRGRAGFLRALALGAGFGAAVYVKQQALLLGLGSSVLLLLWLRDRDDDLAAVATIPAAALATLALLFAAHGGLHAFAMGMGLVQGYAFRHSFWFNLRLVLERVVPVVELSLGAAVVLLGLFIRRDPATRRPALRLATVLLSSAACCLVQFRARPFPHYALLALPCAVAAVALVGKELFERLAPRSPPLARVALPLLAVAALARIATASDQRAFAFGVAPHAPDEWPFGAPAQQLLEQVEAEARGQGAFVIPPGRGGVHFLLGTRALGWPGRYYWSGPGPHDALVALRDPQVRWVVVRTEKDEVTREDCEEGGCDEALRALPAAGFRKLGSTADAEVWRR